MAAAWSHIFEHCPPRGRPEPGPRRPHEPSTAHPHREHSPGEAGLLVPVRPAQGWAAHGCWGTGTAGVQGRSTPELEHRAVGKAGLGRGILGAAGGVGACHGLGGDKAGTRSSRPSHAFPWCFHVPCRCGGCCCSASRGRPPPVCPQLGGSPSGWPCVLAAALKR